VCFNVARCGTPNINRTDGARGSRAMHARGRTTHRCTYQQTVGGLLWKMEFMIRFCVCTCFNFCVSITDSNVPISNANKVVSDFKDVMDDKRGTYQKNQNHPKRLSQPHILSTTTSVFKNQTSVLKIVLKTKVKSLKPKNPSIKIKNLSIKHQY